MRKFLLFIFMCLMVIPVKGLEADVTYKYKYYRLNKILGPMVYKDEVNNEFPFIDENNFVQTDFSDISINKPPVKDGRNIFEYDGFHYSEELKINIIEIKATSNFNIKNINFISNGENLDYEILDKVSENDKSAVYKLNKEYYLDELIVTGNSGTYGNNFIFNFKHDEILVSKIESSYAPNYNFKRSADFGFITSDGYQDVYSLEKLKENNHIKYVGEVKLYNYKDTKYQSYKLEKEYYDEYLESPFKDYIYRDDNDFIVIDNSDEDLSIEESNDSLSTTENSDEKFSDINSTKSEIKTLNVPKVEKISNGLNKQNNSANDYMENNNMDNTLEKVTQYKPILNLNKTKTASNSLVTENHLYDVFKLLILIILLIITIRLKNKVKKYYR